MKNAPKCDACLLHLKKQYRAVGLYGWNTLQGTRVKSNLCSDHARLLRKNKKMIVLKSYRGTNP